MKVAIIGGGAVGMLVAAYFNKANINSVIYTRRREQAQFLHEKGLELIKNGMTTTSKVMALPFSEGLLEDADFIFIAVKQYDLDPILDYLKKNKIKIPIVFLQNGMSHTLMISDLYSESIYLGIVEHGVLKQSDNCVIHTGEGRLKIANYSGEPGKIIAISDALNSIGFPIIIEENWYEILAGKLVVNAVINPLTTLYGIRNGGLLENDFYFLNMRSVFLEVIQALALTNIDNLWNDVISICQNTGSNYSSMYKDIEQGRKTEIQSIIGYILEEGEKRMVPMPRLMFLYNSIKGMEAKGKEERND
ncbi:2-dehydropantoate 2-reductase [Schinkia azotoformans]|uniref:2-dehydropantoate 2-reductase n=1 Tax=Schinkia azotoformans TaxID=1454 RepID=UPI002E20B719|nr:2-dehydropantoate 2-reductase [Schinkia azotoformans]MED4352971.1 2-dehydropantoate 2-reductase [Schinkia azotoformans]